MPYERTRSVIQTRDFLISLLDPKKTPRVPSKVRKEASRMLRHFPTPFDIEQAGKKSSDVFCREYRCDI